MATEYGLDPNQVANWPWQKLYHWYETIRSYNAWEAEQSNAQQMPDMDSFDGQSLPDDGSIPTGSGGMMGGGHRDPRVTSGVSQHEYVITTE